MRLCVVSFKECWQTEAGDWLSDGGFPFQMAAVSSLFEGTTLVVVQGNRRPGGSPLPRCTTVVPLRPPFGTNARRKLSVMLRLPYYVGEIARQVRRADVVHAPLPGDIPFLGMMTAIALRKRLLARYGGAWTANSQTTLMDRITRQCMRWLAGGRNVMLATGCGGVEPASNVSWIFATAISEQELGTVEPKTERLLGEPLQLVYVGRLSPEKGVADLISALSLLKRDQQLDGRVPRLTVIGDGPLRRDLTALARRVGCDPEVSFTGQLSREAMLRQLVQADVCVLPSLTESFCKARLDAMLCGVPVITTDVGFGREIVGPDGERGWLVPPGDASKLAAAVRNLLVQPVDWRALRARCRAYVEARTLEAWAREIGERCARQWRLPFADGRVGQ